MPVLAWLPSGASGGGPPPPPFPAGPLQARAGIGVAGAIYAGWVPPKITVSIGGVQEFSHICLNEFSIKYDLDGNSATCAFNVKNLTPVVGQDVKITYSTPDNYLFAGTLLQCEVETAPTGLRAPFWHCTASGYLFLMDMSDLVLARYDNVGAGTVVADILDRFTEGGFRVGYIPSSLGNVTMTFQFESVSQALERIADACDATWEVTPNRIVNMFPVDTYPESTGVALTNSSDVTNLRYQADLAPTRTRELMQGRSASALETVGPAAQSIFVDDISHFVPPQGVIGGTAISGQSVFSYASVSTGSGNGYLLGCNPRLDDIQEGDAVAVFVDNPDVVAMSALAATMSGMSGQITHYQSDDRYSRAECQGRTDRGVSTLGAAQTGLDFSSHTEDFKKLKVGRTVSCNITVPITVSGTFRIQSITIRPVAGVRATAPQFWRDVHASQAAESYTTFLQRMALKSEQGR